MMESHLLSTALMNENNKVSTLDLSHSKIRTQGFVFVVLLKRLRFSVVNHLAISMPNLLNQEVQIRIEEGIIAFNKYIPRLMVY